MQRVVIDEPYTFIAPRYNRFWHWMVRRILPRQIRGKYGITSVECVGAEKLRASIEAGHGIIIASNHCRPCDPMVIDSLAAAVRRPFTVIASWHVFMASRVQRFLLPRLGGFSVYREGMDRESLKCAVNIVAEGKHPLVIFPEGIITRSNDRLMNFMEGPAFIAKAAAKRRGGGKVVIHPVFIRYFFEGDLRATLTPVIEEIERRLSWQSQKQLPLRDRISKVGGALLALKEMEYLQSPQHGSFAERLQRLLNHLLDPLEDQYTGGRHDGDVMARVKRLRSAILPDLVNGGLSDSERDTRWRHLADVYLVQQLHCYPGDYFENPTPERILETVERYEEDLTDSARPHFPIRAVVTVGDAVVIDHELMADPDRITASIRNGLESLRDASKSQRRTAPTGAEIE